MSTSEFRIEHDSMGDARVPAHVYYGAQTQRAVENFAISGVGFPVKFVHALGLIEFAAAKANKSLGLLDQSKAEPIRAAAREVMEGRHDREFVLDIFQTGSGTSSNMKLTK